MKDTDGNKLRQRLADCLPENRNITLTAAMIAFTTIGVAIVWLRPFSREITLAIAGLLFVAFIVWPLRFGSVGALVSAVFLLTGSVFTVRGWILRDEVYLMAIAAFQISTAVSGFIIAALVERDRRQRRELRRAAIVDGLTGLYNHKHFVSRLQQELARNKRTGQATALMYLDLDNFKPINDTLGHQWGDKYLCAFAALLVDVLRADDTAYRLGGDEFAVILPGTGETGARIVAERVKAEMAARDLGLPDTVTRPSASIGISVSPEYAETAAELMTQADSALYHAKHAGKDSIRLFRDVFADILHYISSGNENLIWSLKSLLWSAAARDNYTYGHAERVSEYATAIADEYGLPPDQVASIRIAAILHDIGRVQVPQDILLKSGPLTALERDQIHRHPGYAAAVLRPLSGIGSVVEDVRHHHEHMDGSGYPSGLVGDAIPIGARVISVADTFDALCNDRPYRDATSTEQAVRELRRMAGTTLDPDLVEIAAALLPQLARRGSGHFTFGHRAS